MNKLDRIITITMYVCLVFLFLLFVVTTYQRVCNNMTDSQYFTILRNIEIGFVCAFSSLLLSKLR